LGYLNKELWNKNDSAMADRDFAISDHLNTINVKLNMPSFLNEQLQLSEFDFEFIYFRNQLYNTFIYFDEEVLHQALPC
jgi:hypothetical protein